MVPIITSTDFEDWLGTLDETDEDKVFHYLGLLEERGIQLGFPYCSAIEGKSKHGGGLRELRVQSQGRPLRVFYRFDSSRNAVVLVGGDKQGHSDTAFYEQAIEASDIVFAKYLERRKAGDVKDDS